jgi:hypothetical protein
MASSDTTSFETGFSLQQRRPERRASLLINIQSRVLANLSDLIKTLFNFTDDAFFELAENAQNNNEQNQFFEAMRELRLHAHDVDARFRELMAAEFDRLEHGIREDTPASKSADALALIDKDKMEIDVAVGNMRTKLRALYPDLLLHLSQRLNEYLGIDWLTEANNPLGQDKLIPYFVDAAERLNLPLKIRLMVYKYFERHVVENLRTTLEEANKILIDAGILPHVRLPRSGKDASRNGGSPANNSTAPATGSAMPATSLADLPLQEAASYTISFPELQAVMANFYNSSLNHRLFSVQPNQGGRELDDSALFSVLNRLQEAQAHTVHEDDPHSQVDHLDVRLLLEHQIAHIARETGARKLRQADDDVINLVSMVFEFILDDRNMAPEISLLLGRLQIPVIKIALKNKKFFSDAEHPTRRLLKLLSQAAIGWEKESLLQRDLLLEELRIVVHRILNEFTGDNLELFSELEQKFGAFLADEQRRADLVEKRVLQSAEGQAKMEQARRVINQLINDRMQGKTLPSVVIDMIDGPWRILMLQTLLRAGRDSDQWRDCLQTVDDLIWSIQPANAGSDRERWIKLIPLLLKRICNGLEAIQHPGLEVEKFLSSLWEIHGQILQYPPDKPLPNSRTVDHTISEPVSARHSAIERQRQRMAERNLKFDPDAPANADLKRRIQALPLGQWVEINTEEGKTRRCKLVFRSEESDLFIFVNRRGHKALETDLSSIIRMMHMDELRLLQSGSFWDRALSAVMVKMTGADKPARV